MIFEEKGQVKGDTIGGRRLIWRSHDSVKIRNRKSVFISTFGGAIMDQIGYTRMVRN